MKIEMNHTREPWYAIRNPEWGNADYRISNKEDDEWANFGQIAYASEYNARRIVACVNACAGMGDPVKEITELKRQLRWRPASELPEKDQVVIATYLNGYGRRRRVRAVYVRQYEEEGGVDEWCVDYCEEQDVWYLKEGWYELIDNWPDYSSVAIIEGVVDYWMLVPPAPEGE